MKDTIIVVILYCITLMIVTLLCTLAFMLFLVGSKLFLFPSISPGMLIALVPTALTQVFLPATLISLFLALVRMRRRPGVKFLSYCFLGILSFIVLFCGPQLIHTSLADEIKKIQADTRVSLRDLAFPQKLIALNDAYLFFEKSEDSTITSGMLISTAKGGQKIIRIDQGTITASEKGTVLNVISPPQTIPLNPRTEESVPFLPDSSIQSIGQAFSEFNDRFISLSFTTKGEFLIICILFVALVLSASFFLRITKWPLANFFIALLVLYCILTLYNFIVFTVLVELEKIVGTSVILSFIPNGLLIFFSGLFFVLDFVLLPERRAITPNA